MKPFKSRTIAGDGGASMTIKSLGEHLYTKTRLPDGDAEYGSITPELLANRRVTSSGAGELLAPAVEYGNNAALRRLVEKGANPFFALRREGSAFRTAVRKNNFEAVGTMLASMKRIADPRDFAGLLDLALAHGDRTVFDRLVDEGIGINLPLRNGIVPLTMAVGEGNLQLVDRLLKAGARPNVVDAYRATPLHLAVRNRRADLVELLLEQKASPGGPSGHQLPDPLREAVVNGDAAIVALLCRYGGVIHASDHYGEPLLHLAVEASNLEVVDALLAAGADINGKNRVSVTPLHLAAQNGNREIVDRFLLDEKLNLSPGLHRGGVDSPLVLAIRGGHDDVARTLIERQADSRSLWWGGDRNALHEAAHQGNLAITQLLLSKKPQPSDLKASDPSGATALHLAARSGHSEIVALLARTKELREKPDKDGRTALHYAAQADRAEVVRRLILGGAVVNGRGREHDGTPLAEAIRSGSTASAELLLRAGAQLEAAGCNAVDVALRSGTPEIITMLLGQRPGLVVQRDQTGKTLLMKAIPHLRPQAIQAVLASGIDVCATDASGDTALHHLAKLPNVAAEGYLMTPEERSARAAAFREIVELLLARGADIDAQNHAHATPLDLAVRGAETELVRTLLALDGQRTGADIAIEQTPRDGAAREHEFEMIRELLDNDRAAKRRRFSEPGE